MKDIVRSSHSFMEAAAVANIANIEPNLCVFEQMTHIVLGLFIPREKADLANFLTQKATNDGISKTTSSSRNYKRSIFEHVVKLIS